MKGGNHVPVISAFYGLVVRMYFKQSEHNPPHFHVEYGEYQGIIEIATLNMIEGNLPLKARVLIMDWGMQHQDELMEIWTSQNFKKIDPLE